MKYDLIGNRYGKLIVIKFYGSINGRRYWVCKCDCGKETNVMTNNLTANKIKSCGCLLGPEKTKGLSYSPIRHAYYNMRKRCISISNKSYKDYGGRGISICEEWNTFEGFLNDMLDSYKEGLTLDRIDVNGNYCKENCRWVDKRTQANNTRTNVYRVIDGEKLTLSEIAEKYNLNYELFRHRILKGWSLERAMKFQNKKEEITYDGVTKTVSEFANDYGMTYHQLKKRLMRGWSVEKALTQPLKKC